MSTLAIDATVLGALIGVVGVVIGAIVTTWLGGKVATSTAREMAKIQKKDHRESRVWELQRAGYSVVLHQLDQVSESAYQIDEGYQNTPSGPAMLDHSGPWASGKTAWAECKSEFAKNQLFFSKAFIHAFQTLESSLEQIEWMEVAPPRIAAGQAEAFSKAYSDLRHTALKDLGLNEEGTAQ